MIVRSTDLLMTSLNSKYNMTAAVVSMILIFIESINQDFFSKLTEIQVGGMHIP